MASSKVPDWLLWMLAGFGGIAVAATVADWQKKNRGQKLYRCHNCNHGPILRGTTHCPNCGTQFDWDA